MRLGLDVTPLLRPRTGIGVFTAMLVRHAEQAGAEVAGLVSPFRRGRLSNGNAVRSAPCWVPGPLAGLCFDYLRWPTVETFLGPVDAYLATNFILPPCRDAVGAAYLHDLGPLVMPQHYRPRQRARFERRVRSCCRSARVLMTPTRAVADELIDLGLAPRERIVVVPPGCPQTPLEVPRSPPSGRYLLSVSNFERRKNLPFLVRAFARAAPSLPHELLLVGAGPCRDEILGAAAQAGVADRVRLVGQVAPEQLRGLYAGADLMLTASGYEGFGLPVLEAMALSCPVLASDIPAHREVADGAARLAPCNDEEAFADALLELMRDADARDGLARRGKERCADFSWRATVRGVRSAIEQVQART